MNQTEKNRVSLIVAHDENRLIGANGDLPWRLPNDLKQFRRLTLNKVILMGRKTWDSLGKPLDQRDNWVLTRDASFSAEGARVFNNVEDAIAAHQSEMSGELMVIGGGEIYKQALPFASRIYLTKVETHAEGDAWFPEIDQEQWMLTNSEKLARETLDEIARDERHTYAYSFLVLDRTAL